MDGEHFRYYKKRTYDKSRSVIQAISKKNFDRNIKIVEKITYDMYWRAVSFHRQHRDICELYVLQCNPIWIEVELIIK